ncbi:hypothetical protein P4H61_16810 [Paenibacillus peoriae]|uniref:hypothetical protein n=1 Tax=Paenibacillus peoriae TaxID=59893 RepID=UPI00026C6270|nr:hypothetical protein [Paenibacillus peoriae]MEC0183149.1 hypothetical protein [Paenibacillus peoriae]
MKNLYGLILEIDTLEDEKLSKVQKYINEIINQVIETVRIPLYEHVPEPVIPYTADTYLNHFKPAYTLRTFRISSEHSVISTLCGKEP